MNQEGVLASCAVCNTETHRRCSRCLNVYYCNKEHQREDWKRHKSECLPKLSKQVAKKDRKVADVPESREDNVREVEDTIKNLQEQVQRNSIQKDSGLPNDSKTNLKSMKTIKNEGSAAVRSSKQNSDVLIGENALGENIKRTNNLKNSICVATDGKVNSVISSVVCTDSDSVKLSAITYEGSSEQEILSESAQQLSTVGFMGTGNSGNVLKSINRSVDSNKMAVVPEMPSRVNHKEYPESSLKGSALMNNYYTDTSDPCYEICQRVIRDMTTYGVCVLDNFLGRDRGLLVRKEVLDMYKSGIFTAGQLVSDPGGSGTQSVRSDRITWIDGREPQCHNIGMLINQVDSIILRSNKMPNNGKMGDYIINTRTKAMVACYPGSGSNYVKHVDNPNRDGRCITAIYYLNLDWDVKRCGGLLRVFPEGTDQVANIEPIFDRMLFFWSDRRNPHEVQPAFDTRYAITLWYFDAQEREEALRLYKSRATQPSSSK